MARPQFRGGVAGWNSHNLDRPAAPPPTGTRARDRATLTGPRSRFADVGRREIIYMPLGGLPPAAVNPKRHDIEAIVASLDRFGWTNPALLDERTGRLVAGHGRREACISIRARGETPPSGVLVDDDGEWLVPVVRGWASRNDTEAAAYIVADNRLTEAGGWYMTDLAQLLEDVLTDDVTLVETMGYNDEDLDELLRRIDPETLNPGPAGEGWDPLTETSAADRAAQPADEPATSPGGDHTAPATDNEPPASRPAHTCPSCGHTFTSTR